MMSQVANHSCGNKIDKSFKLLSQQKNKFAEESVNWFVIASFVFTFSNSFKRAFIQLFRNENKMNPPALTLGDVIDWKPEMTNQRSQRNFQLNFHASTLKTLTTRFVVSSAQ